jgi:hypothetical protein
MSRNSKAKRDQRKKQQPRRPFARLGRAPDVQNHAVMQDAEGRVIAAIGLQGDEWLLAIGGQTMGNADNPVPMLAMLKHLANLQEKEGNTVTLTYSEQLQAMIDDLARDEGKSADDYLAQLVAEFEAGGEDIDADDAAEVEASIEAVTDAAQADAQAAAAAAPADDAKPSA